MTAAPTPSQELWLLIPERTDQSPGKFSTTHPHCVKNTNKTPGAPQDGTREELQAWCLFQPLGRAGTAAQFLSQSRIPVSEQVSTLSSMPDRASGAEQCFITTQTWSQNLCNASGLQLLPRALPVPSAPSLFLHSTTCLSTR